MADGAYATWRDAALRYEVDPLLPTAELAVACAREAEHGLGCTLEQARRWAKLQLRREAGKQLRDLIYLRVERRVQRTGQMQCSRCGFPMIENDAIYVPVVDGQELGLHFCSRRCADLRLAGPLKVEYCADAA